MSMDVSISKRGTTAYNRFVKVRARLLDVWQASRSFSRTHEEHLTALTHDIYETADWQKLRHHDRAYLRGMMDVLMSNWYRYDLVWMHLHGDTYVTPEAMNRDGISYDTINVDKSQHVWKHSRRGFSWRIDPDKVML